MRGIVSVKAFSLQTICETNNEAKRIWYVGMHIKIQRPWCLKSFFWSLWVIELRLVSTPLTKLAFTDSERKRKSNQTKNSSVHDHTWRCNCSLKSVFMYGYIEPRTWKVFHIQISKHNLVSASSSLNTNPLFCITSVQYWHFSQNCLW